jgi:hypothetical protein
MAPHGGSSIERASIRGLAGSALAIALLAFLLAHLHALGGPPRPVAHQPSLRLPAASSVPRSHHSRVAVVVMENKSYRQVIGSDRAPYVNRLAHRYGLATRFFGVSHPSLPNYLALTSGSTLSVHRDCTTCQFKHPNLATQLDAAGVPWKAYVAGVPGRCYQGARVPGYYRKALNPFVYFDSVTDSSELCRRIVPNRQLNRDLLAGALPAFSWITPSLCEDTHACGVGAGDRYLARLIPALRRGLGPHGVLYLLWDEGTSNRGCCGHPGGGHVPAIVVGPDVRARARTAASLNDYSVLRSVESAFELPHLGHARGASHALQSLFVRRLDIA